MAYEGVLPLRPTNVVHQLGATSRVPLLNGRTLLGSLASTQSAIWIPRVTTPDVIAPILRAAAHLKSLVGFALIPESLDPRELRGAYSPSGFLRSVVDAAGRISRVPPFLVHVQEPPLPGPSGPQFESVLHHIANCLDAGFTSFGVDLTACAADVAVDLAEALLLPVLELELGVVLRPRVELGTSPTRVADAAHDVAHLVAAVRRRGIEPDLVVLPGPDTLGAEALALARGAAQLLAPAGVAWRDPGGDEPRPEGAEGNTAGIVRALLGGKRIATLAEDASGTERLEATVYLEATGAMTKLRGTSSAQSLLRSLQP